MKTALFPGTFDPPTSGHLDIIKRASLICNKLIVGVSFNIAKRSSFFSLEERLEMLKTITESIPNIVVTNFSGLVVDFAKEQKIDFLVRGLRAFSDFEYEFQMALANRKMSGTETVFLMTDERHSYVSSSLIREIASHGRRLHEFVPDSIESQVFQALTQKKSS